MVSNLPPEKICEYKAAFEMIDRDKKGKITVDDLSEFFYNLDQNFSYEDFIEMIIESGIESKKEIDFETFLMLIIKKLKENDTEEEIAEAYKKFDPKRNGYFTVNDFKAVLYSLGEQLTSSEVDKLIDQIDVDENGRISYESFSKFMGRG